MLSDREVDREGTGEDRPSPPPQLTAQYPCKFECGFVGSPAQLAGHYRSEHRGEKPEASASTAERGPPSREESPISDLVSDLPVLKSAVEVSRWKGRLRVQDPAMFRLLFPSESGEGSGEPSARLANVAFAEYLRSLQDREEEKRQPSGDGEIVELRREIMTLKEEGRKRELEALRNEIKELRGEIRAGTDSITGLAREAKDVLSTWQRGDGGPFLRSLSPLAGAFSSKVLQGYAPEEYQKLQQKLVEAGARDGIARRLPSRLVVEQ